MTKYLIVSFVLILITPLCAWGEEYSLPDLLKRGELNTETISIALGEEEKYKGLRDEAYGASYPNIEAMALVAGPVPQAIGDIENVSSSSSVGPFDWNNYGLVIREEVNVLIPFFTFGKITNLKKAGDHGVKAAKQGVRLKKAELYRDLYKAYWSYQTGLIVLAKLQEGEKILDEVSDKIVQWIDDENPAVTENDRLKLDYFRLQIKLRELETEKAIDQSLNAIAVLAGFNRDEQFSVKKETDIKCDRKVPTLGDFLLMAEKFRPELKLALESKLAMQNLHKAAVKHWYPEFFVGGEFKHSWSNATTDQTNPFVRDDYNYITGAIGLGLRLQYDFMTNKAKERKALGNYNKASAMYNFAARNIPYDVKDKHELADKMLKKCTLKESAESAVKRWLTAEMMNFEMGIVDTRSLIEALVASFETNLTRYTTALSFHYSYADLLYAAGRTEDLLEE